MKRVTWGRPAKPRDFTFNDPKNVADGPGGWFEEPPLDDTRINHAVICAAASDTITTCDQFAAELGKLMGRALLLNPALLLAELDAHASTIRDAIKYEEWCASDPEGNPRDPGA